MPPSPCYTVIHSAANSVNNWTAAGLSLLRGLYVTTLSKMVRTGSSATKQHSGVPTPPRWEVNGHGNVVSMACDLFIAPSRTKIRRWTLPLHPAMGHMNFTLTDSLQTNWWPANVFVNSTFITRYSKAKRNCLVGEAKIYLNSFSFLYPQGPSWDPPLAVLWLFRICAPLWPSPGACLCLKSSLIL